MALKLGQAGFAVTTEADGQAGLDRALAEPFDLILLDAMVPRLSGIECAAASGTDPPPATRRSCCLDVADVGAHVLRALEGCPRRPLSARPPIDITAQAPPPPCRSLFRVRVSVAPGKDTMHELLLADLDWLTPEVAVGGDLHPHPSVASAQVRWLVGQGVTDLVDCRLECSDADLVARVAPELRYHHLPVDDHGGRMPPEWWEAGATVARAAQARRGRLFVHCHMGVNRGPSLALAVLIDRGWRPGDAWRLLRNRRPQAYAVYLPQFLEHRGRAAEAVELAATMDAECDHAARVATVGRLRRAQSGAGYRFPLAG